jgi:hypothetical protein
MAKINAPDTGTGTVLCPTDVPLPSAPATFVPQQYAAPVVVTPQLRWVPALTVVKLSGAAVFGGTGFGGKTSGGEVIVGLHEARMGAKKAIAAKKAAARSVTERMGDLLIGSVVRSYCIKVTDSRSVAVR